MPVGVDGQISIFNAAGTTHVLLDVQGWFAAGNQDRSVAVPAPTTKTVSSADIASFTGNSTTNATLMLRPSATPPVVGDDITLTSSALTPEGFLGKVTAVTAAAGGMLKVATQPTTLADAYTSLVTGYDGPLGGSIPAGANAAATPIVLARADPVRPADGTVGGPSTISIGIAPGLLQCSAEVQISSMSLQLTDTHFDVSLDHTAITNPLFHFHFDSTPVLSIDATTQGGVTCKLNPKLVPTIKFVIPGEVSVEVEIAPVVTFSIKTKGRVSEKLTLFGSYSVDASVSGGVHGYSSGHTVSNVHGSDSSLAFSVGVGGSLGIKLDGIAGVVATVVPTLTASVDAQACLELSGSVVLTVSLTLGNFGFQIKQQVGSYTWGPWRLTATPQCPPPPNDDGKGNPNNQPVINPASDPPDGTVGDPIDTTETATGGTGTTTWGINKGILPPGTALDPTTGEITGTPIQPGDYPVTITVLDSIGGIGSRNITIHINPLHSNGIWTGTLRWRDTLHSNGPRGSDPQDLAAEGHSDWVMNWSTSVLGVLPAFALQAYLDYPDLVGTYSQVSASDENGCTFQQSTLGSTPFRLSKNSTISVDDAGARQNGGVQAGNIRLPGIGITSTETDVAGGAAGCTHTVTVTADPPGSGREGFRNGGVNDGPSFPVPLADPTHFSGKVDYTDPDNKPDSPTEQTTQDFYTLTWNLQLVDSPDSDYDGYSDYLEIVKYGTDPQDSSSHP